MDRTRPLRSAITRALAHVEEHLDAPLTLDDVARAAHLSAYHFHREFRAAIGEPVARYITRRRLERAALRLAYEPWRTVTDVALASGFSSPSNFAKAFHAHFGCSPSVLRSTPGDAPDNPGTNRVRPTGFDPRALHAPETSNNPAAERVEIARKWDARVRFEHCEERHLACLAGPGGYNVTMLEETWGRLIGWARQLDLADADGGIDAWGCAFDSPSLTQQSLCRYHACVPSAPGMALPEPLFPARMHAGRYAVFTWEGPVAELERTYREIYSCWLPEAALMLDGFAPWEHHIGDGPVAGHILLELWFKVRPRARGQQARSSAAQDGKRVPRASP